MTLVNHHPVRLKLKPVGQPRKFQTLKTLNSWSLEVLPRSHEFQAIERHLYLKYLVLILSI